MRHLLKLYEQQASGNQSNRIQSTIHWAEKFFYAKPLYIEQNPRAQEVNQELCTRTINYLCHEFFNKDWHCLFFSQMADFMREIYCEFVCSAKLMWHFDPQTFNSKEQILLAEARDSILQEQLKDYFLNESFRMDIFVKNGRKLTPKERENRLLHTSFVLLKAPFGFQNAPEAPQEFQAFCQSILEFFAKDSYSPKTLQNLAESFNVAIKFLLPILCAMMTQGFLHPIQRITPKILKQARAHNKVLFSQENKQGSRRFLASPLIGGGIDMDDITWTCLKGCAQGICEKKALVEFVLQCNLNLAKELINDEVCKFLRHKELYVVLGIID